MPHTTWKLQARTEGGRFGGFKCARVRLTRLIKDHVRKYHQRPEAVQLTRSDFDEIMADWGHSFALAFNGDTDKRPVTRMMGMAVISCDANSTRVFTPEDVYKPKGARCQSSRS